MTTSTTRTAPGAELTSCIRGGEGRPAETQMNMTLQEGRPLAPGTALAADEWLLEQFDRYGRLRGTSVDCTRPMIELLDDDDSWHTPCDSQSNDLWYSDDTDSADTGWFAKLMERTGPCS